MGLGHPLLRHHPLGGDRFFSDRLAELSQLWRKGPCAQPVHVCDPDLTSTRFASSCVVLRTPCCVAHLTAAAGYAHGVAPG
jgi:hypothetical protein